MECTITDLQIHTEREMRSSPGEWRALKINRVGITEVTGDVCLGKQVLRPGGQGGGAKRTKGPRNCADTTKLCDKADKTEYSKLGGLGLRPCCLHSVNFCVLLEE